MAEYLTEAEYWKSVALEQALRAAKMEAENASALLRQHGEDLHRKYDLIAGVDQMIDRNGKIEIVRAPKLDTPSLEAVK